MEQEKKELIQFKDYPLTDTPLNSSNLNNNFDYLNEKIGNLESLNIEDKTSIVNAINKLSGSLSYSPGDNVEIDNTNGESTFSGFVTNGQRTLIFTIPVLKSLKNINNITVVSANIYCRVPSGGYLSSTASGVNEITNTDEAYTFTFYKVGDNLISVMIDNTGTFGKANNIPISVSINKLVLELS